ncbi:MAG TPA: hypothetical protein VNE38_05195 [Ktedonobacteraceae bacterium]|nr:hypothetical protein [Ktedonobacteraceae bacterium]
MNTTIPLYQFQRNSPFYPMVLNYTVLLLAFKEFGAAGIALKLQGLSDPEYQEVLDDARIKGNAELIGNLKETLIKELNPPLALVSEFQDQRVIIDAFATMRELGNNISYLMDDLKLSAVSALLVHAYEATEKLHNAEPLWEFLYHCRNAGAHGGRFSFRNGQPKHPAIWGKYTLIRATHEGIPLISHRGFRGLFAPGDPLRLLWDIEQQYILPTL